MKLIVAVVQVEDAGALVDGLVAAGLGATRVDAAGGFLRRENAVALVAAEERSLPFVLATIRRTCRRRVATWRPPVMDGMIPQVGAPIEVEIGGAVVFVLPVERVEHLSERDRARPGTWCAREEDREAAALRA